MTEDSNRFTILAVREKLKIVNQRRGVDKTKSFLIPPYLIGLCEWNPPIHVKSTPYRNRQGPCTELLVGEMRKTGGDDSECLISWKLF